MKLRPARLEKYDLAIAVCGYEARSTQFLARQAPLARRKIAVGYESHKVLSFDRNRKLLISNGYKFHDVGDSAFRDLMREELRRASDVGGFPRVFLDISCLTRFRLALLVELLAECGARVDAFYSLSKYTAPGKAHPLNDFVGPVTPFFSGWNGEIDKPTAVVSGLGYEYMRAIGLIDHLDAADVWLFFPRSPISKYDDQVRKSNELLLRDSDPSRVIDYPVDDFSALCRDLFGLTASLRSAHRCVLLPLGPKLFAFASLLAAATYREASVWRASAGEFAEPSERIPSEFSYLVGVDF